MSQESLAAPPRVERRALVALYLATVAVFCDMYITQPILPVLSREFSIAPATAGLSVSAVVLAIGIASSLYGPLSDTLGRKPVMVWCCALLALPTLLCALAPSFGVLLIFRALQGLLIPGVTGVAVAYLDDQFAASELGAVVGGYIAATVTGGLLGRVLSGLITDVSHWRAAFGFFGIVSLASALNMAWALPRQHIQRAVRWGAAYRQMFRHLGNRRLLGAFLIGGTLFFGFIGIFTYLPYYLTGAPFYLSTGLVSSVYVVYIAGVIVAPFAGRWSARRSRRAIMAVGLLVAIVGMLGTLVHSLPLIVLSLIVLCLGMFTAQSTAPAFVTATATEAKGGANALYLTFYYVGATFGSTLPGLAWQSMGWPGVVATCAGSLVLGLLADAVLCR